MALDKGVAVMELSVTPAIPMAHASLLQLILAAFLMIPWNEKQINGVWESSVHWPCCASPGPSGWFSREQGSPGQLEKPILGMCRNWNF